MKIACKRTRNKPLSGWKPSACLAAILGMGSLLMPLAISASQDQATEPPASSPGHAGGLAQAPWPKFGGGAQNRGTGGSKTRVQARPWTFAMLAHNSSVGPIALSADGIVFIAGEYLHALNGATGKLKWELPSVRTNVAGAVLAADNTLYISGEVGSLSGVKYKVFALDAATGKARWAFSLPHSATNTPALGANGALYVQCTNGVLYAIDRVTGKQRWTFRLQEPVFSSKEVFHTILPVVMCSPAVGPDGTVYTSYHHLYAIDGATGQEKWKYSPTDAILGISPAIGPDGVLYIGMEKQNHGLVAAIEGRTGNLLWTYPTQGHTLYYPPCLDTNGMLYAACDGGILYALNAQSGALKWQISTRGGYMSVPVVDADHVVYVGGGDGRFSALDGGTGGIRWTTPLNDAAIYAALDANGLVYAVTRSGLVCALRAENGAIGPRPSAAQ